MPGGVLGEHAADHRTEGQGQGTDGPPDPDGPGLLVMLRIGRRDDGQRGRSEQRRTEALQTASCDQRVGTSRQPRQHRGNGEHDEPDEEEAAAPEVIGQPAAGEQQTGEEEDVGADHPLDAGL